MDVASQLPNAIILLKNLCLFIIYSVIFLEKYPTMVSDNKLQNYRRIQIYIDRQYVVDFHLWLVNKQMVRLRSNFPCQIYSVRKMQLA